MSMQDFREGTLRLAMENGFPILAPSGRILEDARCAWFLEALDSHIESTQEQRHRPGWFSASSLGRSDAEMIAEYRGEPGELRDAQTLRIFSVGNDRDATYKRWIKEAGLSAVGSDDDRKVKEEIARSRGIAPESLIEDYRRALEIYEQLAKRAR